MDDLEGYRKDFLSAYRRIRAGKAPVHIPRQRELHRKRPHSHFHATPEIFIQTGGATDFDCAGETFRMHTGEICVMPRGVPHSETPIDTSTPYGVAVCYYGRDGLSLIRGRCDMPGQITSHTRMHFKGGRGHGIFAYLDDLSDLDGFDATTAKTYCQILLQAFFLAACAELDRPQLETKAADTPLVVEAEKFALAHLHNARLGVAAIASELGCTGDHLSRMFHRRRGMPMSTWIARERIEQARRLLSSQNYNISEVGWACGFNEPSYFIRIFRRYMGITPRQYRERVQIVRVIPE